GISGNSIFANGINDNSLGIDLAPLGFTANDAGDGDSGSNNLQNFPVITSATTDGTTTTIGGTLDTASPATAKVDVYSTPADGEGKVFLGTATPSSGGAWTLVYAGTAPYGKLTATATKSSNTSEFSAEFTMPLGPGLPLLSIATVGQTPTGLPGSPSTFATFGPAAVPDSSGSVVFWAT